MYFLVALFLTIVSLVLFLVFKGKKKLHLDVLLITFGAATLMWLIDCFASIAEGEPFVSFDLPTDIWISLATLVGGVLFWGIVTLVMNHRAKKGE